MKSNDSKETQSGTIVETPLTGDLLSVLVGSMLGDGHLKRSDGPRTASFVESHATDQKNYLLWKWNVWGNRALGVKERPPYKSTHQPSIGFSTHYSTDLYPWWEMFYGHGQRTPKGSLHKLFSDGVLPYMTPLALAIWYMDDGTLLYNNPAFSSHPRNHDVGKRILKVFGVVGEPYGKDYARSTGSSYGLIIKGDAGRWLLSMMEPHILPELRHKIRPVSGQDIDGVHFSELVKRGATLTDLAGVFGVGRDVIRHKAKQLGMGVSHLRPLPGADLAKFVGEEKTGAHPRLILPEKLLRELVAADNGVRRIAARFGVSHKIVDRFLDLYGIEVRDIRGGAHNTCPQLTEEVLRRLWVDEQRTMHEMTIILGCCRSTIREHLKAWGIVRPF